MKMNLKNWAEFGWLKPHKTSGQEIQNLLAIVDRDLADARQSNLSADWRFGIAYNAALKLCTILLFSSGYRPEKSLAHYRTLQALPLILGEKWQDEATYLDTCRIKRNTVEYDCIGGVANQEADELIDFVEELKSEVLKWLEVRSHDVPEE